MILANIEIPSQVLEVMNRLSMHGYEVYLVGKCVRLLINGDGANTLLDFDIAVNAELSRIRTIFGGYTVNEDRLDKGEILIRVLGYAISAAPFRKSIAPSPVSADGVVYTDDLREELFRHSFTFDALALGTDCALVDLWNGLEHAQKGVIKAIDGALEANPRNILTALAYYSAEDEFTITDGTKAEILRLKDNLSLPDPKTVREPFEQILLGKRAALVLTEYAGVINAFIPETAPLCDKTYGDLFTHTAKSVNLSSPVNSLRYAMFFHEIGKPDCYARHPDGSASFYGHAERAGIYALRIMTRLGCGTEDMEEACFILAHRVETEGVTEENLPDLRERFSDARLKLLLLFNCANIRGKIAGERDAYKAESEAMNYRRLAGLLN